MSYPARNFANFTAFAQAANYRSQKSLTFDGATDWMVVYNMFGTDTFKIGLYQKSTVSMWIKSTKNDASTEQTIINRWFPTVGGGLMVNEGGWRIFLWDVPAGGYGPAVTRALNFQVCTYWLNGLWIYSSASFPLDEWVHVVLTYGGTGAGASELKMYWNGVLQTDYDLFDNWTTTAINSNAYSHLLWGVQYTAWPVGAGGPSSWPPVLTFWFEGLMDETALYRQELDATEVLHLYHCGRPQSPMHVGLPNGKPCQRTWRMGDWTDGTAFLGLLKICWCRYPIAGGYSSNAFWNNPLAIRRSEDVPP